MNEAGGLRDRGRLSLLSPLDILSHLQQLLDAVDSSAAIDDVDGLRRFRLGGIDFLSRHCKRQSNLAQGNQGRHAQKLLLGRWHHLPHSDAIYLIKGGLDAQKRLENAYSDLFRA